MGEHIQFNGNKDITRKHLSSSIDDSCSSYISLHNNKSENSINNLSSSYNDIVNSEWPYRAIIITNKDQPNNYSNDKRSDPQKDNISLKTYYNTDSTNGAELNDLLTYDNKKDTFGEYHVDCGSIEKILENLMGFNLSFLTVFLDTFVLFMTPRDFFNFLVDQFNKNEPIIGVRERSSTLKPTSNPGSNAQIANSFDNCYDKTSHPINTLDSNISIDVDVIKVSAEMSADKITTKDPLSCVVSGDSNACPSQQRKNTESSIAFSVASNNSLSNYSDATNAITKTTRSIALKILRKWISTYYYDFEKEPELLNELHEFLTNAENSCDKKDPLWRQINLVSITLQDTKQPLVKPQNGTGDENIHWDILKHNEVATTLTVIEHKLFKELNLRELLIYVFGKSHERKNNTTSVTRLIENSTRLTYLVETQVVKYPSSRVRALEMETWISVLKCLLDTKNYSSMVAILGALNSTSVDRMEKTKKKINAKKRKIKHDIETELGISNYYDNLRVYLDNNTHIKAIPFLGSYITIFNRLKQSGIVTKDNKIKFRTCRHVSKLLQSISTRQKYYESKEIDPSKVMYMKKILMVPSLTNEEISAMSYKHEPKLSNN